MSTRCNVQVIQTGVDWKQEIQLYHHCDGYPSNMLPLIAKAFRLSKGGWEAGRAGKAASFLCAVDPGQMEPEQGMTPHGDIEYLYKITVCNNNGGTIGEKPEWLVETFDRKGKSLHAPTEVLKASKDKSLLEL